MQIMMLILTLTTALTLTLRLTLHLAVPITLQIISTTFLHILHIWHLHPHIRISQEGELSKSFCPRVITPMPNTVQCGYKDVSCRPFLDIMPKAVLPKKCMRQIFGIGTVRYAEGLWRMCRHGPVIAHCTDSEDFPRTPIITLKSLSL